MADGLLQIQEQGDTQEVQDSPQRDRLAFKGCTRAGSAVLGG